MYRTRVFYQVAKKYHHNHSSKSSSAFQKIDAEEVGLLLIKPFYLQITISVMNFCTHGLSYYQTCSPSRLLYCRIWE
jgi:hypothetical protein